MKKIGVLGSTGSIGTSSVSLLLNELKDEFEVEFLSFHSNAKLAFNQALSLNAKYVIATSKKGYDDFLQLNIDNKIDLRFGSNDLHNACKDSSIEVILIAITGVCGLEFALSSIILDKKRTLAIANKESIICGFHLIEQKLMSSKTQIFPVDSEHNSLLRLLNGVREKDISSAFITASGGPFYGKKFYDLKNVNVREVVSHPTWNMGAKISVDSATMANKGLELIEACKLFNFKANKIDAFISRGSLLHAGVNLQDGSSHWFLSKPEMKIHISHAISKNQIHNIKSSKISINDLQNLKFHEILKDEFPIFFIAKKIAESESILGAISFNILNEIAVEQFLNSKINYTQILNIIEDNLMLNPSNFKFENVQEINEYFKEIKTILYSKL